MIDDEVLKTAQSAYETYIRQHLPRMSTEISPAQFQREAERLYADVLNGGALSGRQKPGDDEAKITKHTKTVAAAAKVLAEIAARSEPSAAEEFYSSPVQDLFLLHLDLLMGSSIDGDEHSIFANLTEKYEERFVQDMRDLNVLDPDEVTRVSEYGPQIVEFVQGIIKKQFAYATPGGSVFFDIEAFEKAGNTYARLEPWNRRTYPRPIEGDGTSKTEKEANFKRSRADFALWKAS